MTDKTFLWYQNRLRAVGSAVSEMHNSILEKTGKGPAVNNITVDQLEQWLLDQCKIHKSVNDIILKEINNDH